jgi:NDP-sugar pyrophosphorylase family protein
VLTAGFGTRLRPLTWLKAKPALPVAGVPLVTRILRWLAGAGVDYVVLNLHHLPQSIQEIVGDGRALGVNVRYSFEDPILGSAGGVRRALPLLDASRVLVVNGDTLTDVDLHAMQAAHEVSRALVTMALVPNEDPDRYGGVLVDPAGAVTGFVPRGPAAASSWHFVGVQLLEAAALATVSPDHASESVTGLYPTLIRERPGSVRGYRCTAAFRDIGTPADYLESSLALAAGDDRALVGARCTVAENAAVVRTILWDDVIVETGVRLRECVVTDGVRVAAGSNFTRQILLPWNPARHASAAGLRDDTGVITDQGLLVVPLAGRPRRSDRANVKGEGHER